MERVAREELGPAPAPAAGDAVAGNQQQGTLVCVVAGCSELTTAVRHKDTPFCKRHRKTGEYQQYTATGCKYYYYSTGGQKLHELPWLTQPSAEMTFTNIKPPAEVDLVARGNVSTPYTLEDWMKQKQKTSSIHNPTSSGGNDALAQLFNVLQQSPGVLQQSPFQMTGGAAAQQPRYGETGADVQGYGGLGATAAMGAHVAPQGLNHLPEMPAPPEELRSPGNLDFQDLMHLGSDGTTDMGALTGAEQQQHPLPTAPVAASQAPMLEGGNGILLMGIAPPPPPASVMAANGMLPASDSGIYPGSTSTGFQRGPSQHGLPGPLPNALPGAAFTSQAMPEGLPVASMFQEIMKQLESIRLERGGRQAHAGGIGPLIPPVGLVDVRAASPELAPVVKQIKAVWQTPSNEEDLGAWAHGMVPAFQRLETLVIVATSDVHKLAYRMALADIQSLHTCFTTEEQQWRAAEARAVYKEVLQQCEKGVEWAPGVPVGRLLSKCGNAAACLALNENDDSALRVALAYLDQEVEAYPMKPALFPFLGAAGHRSVGLCSRILDIMDRANERIEAHLRENTSIEAVRGILNTKLVMLNSRMIACHMQHAPSGEQLQRAQNQWQEVKRALPNCQLSASEKETLELNIIMFAAAWQDPRITEAQLMRKLMDQDIEPWLPLRLQSPPTAAATLLLAWLRLHRHRRG